MLIEAKYHLPFDNSEYQIKITQGNSGPWSHFLIKKELPSFPGVFTYSDLTHAVDFALPFGSEVRAARAGRVCDYWLRSDWFYEGLDPEIGNNPPFMSTNFVVVEHEDGTYAWYSHLNRERIVSKDRLVEAGEIIAYTGKSGWIAEIPHLHFQVNGKSNIPPLNPSLPVAFLNYRDSLDHETLLKESKIWFGE